MEDEATEAFVAAANDELSWCFPFNQIHMLNDMWLFSHRVAWIQAIVRRSGLV
jgi:hypothetical protein